MGDLAVLAWGGTTLLVGLPLVFYLTRLVRRIRVADRETVSVLIKWSLASTLVVIGVVGSMAPDAPAWLRTLSTICVYYCLVLSYFANLHLFREHAQPIFPTPVFRLTTGASLLLILLDILRGSNNGWFLANEPFQPTLAYYSYYVVGIGVLIGLYGNLMCLFWRYLWSHPDPIYFVRRLSGFVAFLIAFLNAFILLANLLLSISFGTRYIVLLNALYAYGLMSSCAIMLINIFPTPWLQKLAQPVIRYRNYQTRRQHRMLTYLHDRLGEVVANQQRVDRSLLSIHRLIAEISDERDMIWSHLPRRKAISAREEAAYINQLQCNQARIDAPGPYAPVPAKYVTPRHMVHLAQALQSIEKGKR